MLLSESSSDEDDDIADEQFHQMLKCHLIKKKYQSQYHNDKEVSYSIRILLCIVFIGATFFSPMATQS